MDLARHHLETIWQENTTRETSQAVERWPGQILERHDMAGDSTRQGHLETTCWGLRPITGHNGCLMMMNDDILQVKNAILQEWVIWPLPCISGRSGKRTLPTCNWFRADGSHIMVWPHFWYHEFSIILSRGRTHMERFCNSSPSVLLFPDNL